MTAGGDEAAGDAVLAEVARELGARLAALWLFDPGTGLLHHARDWAPEDDVEVLRAAGRRLTFAPGVGLPGRVLESGAPAWIADIGSDVDFPRAELALRAGVRSVVGAPLVSRDGVLGVLECFGDGGAPSAEQLAAVTLAGAQLAAYLAGSSIEDRLRASEETSASIMQAALDCIVTMDHRGRVLDFNPAAEATFGYSREQATGALLAELILPPEFRDAHRLALEAYVAGGTPGAILGRRLELSGQRADGSTFPVELTVSRLGPRDPPVFVGFLRDITERRTVEDQLGALLEREHAERARATHAERETREVAQMLQRSLLPPRLPAIGGLELGAAYRAGTEGWEVGGDFYDVFQLAPGRWAFAIGDVCGKGPRAAALTGTVRYALRDAAVGERDSPSAVLSTVNDELVRDGGGDLCTMIFASADLRSDTASVTMAVGGHPLPLLARGRGAVEAVGRSGPLLGYFETVRAPEVTIELRPADLLFLYTDGLTEARTERGRLGEPRVAALLSEVAHHPPQRVVELIDGTLARERAAGQADDVAMLAMAAGG